MQNMNIHKSSQSVDNKWTKKTESYALDTPIPDDRELMPSPWLIIPRFAR